VHFQGTGERLNSGHPPRRPTDHHGSLQGADADSAVRVGGGVRRAVAAKAVVTATAGAGWRRSTARRRQLLWLVGWMFAAIQLEMEVFGREQAGCGWRFPA